MSGCTKMICVINCTNPTATPAMDHRMVFFRLRRATNGISPTGTMSKPR